MTRIGIVAALPDEARCLGIARPKPGGRYEPGPDTVLRVAGMGRVNASRGARLLLADGVDALASWGYCGALDPALVTGTIILPTRLVDTGGKVVFHADTDWHDRLSSKLANTVRIATGPMLSHATIIRSPSQKHSLRQTSNAIAVDMESAAVAAVAHGARLPFVAIRSVSDAADAALPTVVTALLDDEGRLHPWRGCTHWLRHPAQTGALLRLARGARHARHSLKTVAQLIGRQVFD